MGGLGTGDKEGLVGRFGSVELGLASAPRSMLLCRESECGRGRHRVSRRVRGSSAVAVVAAMKSG
eukprot:4216566-Prymnesium_polylepis.1